MLFSIQTGEGTVGEGKQVAGGGSRWHPPPLLASAGLRCPQEPRFSADSSWRSGEVESQEVLHFILVLHQIVLARVENSQGIRL